MWGGLETHFARTKMADISSFSLQGGRSGRYYENYSENYSRAFRQHTSTSNMALISVTCSSNDERDLSNYGSDIPTSGKNLKILPQLETSKERQRSAEQSERLGNFLRE